MSTNVWSAVIAAATALVVFLLTQIVVGRRESRTRASDRRNAALIAAQDAALEVRSSLNAYGPLARRASGRSGGDELAAASRRVDDALARLDVAVTRIDAPGVAATITAWRDRARWHYLSAEEVPTAEELALWEAMNAAVRAALG
jgi:hypothetical protein